MAQFLSFLSSLLKHKCEPNPSWACSADPALETSFVFIEAPSGLQPYILAKQPDDPLDMSYDFFAAHNPACPVRDAQEELIMLEGQAKQLRATIARRKHVDGANCRGDNVSSIVAHYQRILDQSEPRIAELTQFIQSQSTTTTSLDNAASMRTVVIL